jgi:hypothetical protein
MNSLEDLNNILESLATPNQIQSEKENEEITIETCDQIINKIGTSKLTTGQDTIENDLNEIIGNLTQLTGKNDELLNSIQEAALPVIFPNLEENPVEKVAERKLIEDEDEASLKAEEAVIDLPEAPKPKETTLQEKLSDAIETLLGKGHDKKNIVITGEIAKIDGGAQERIEQVIHNGKLIGYKIYCTYQVEIKGVKGETITVNGEFFSNARTPKKAHAIAKNAGLNLFASAAKAANGMETNKIKIYDDKNPSVDEAVDEAARQALLEAKTFKITGETNSSHQMLKMHSFTILDGREHLKVVVKAIKEGQKYLFKGNKKQKLTDLPNIENQLPDQFIYDHSQLEKRKKALLPRDQTIKDFETEGKSVTDSIGAHISELREETEELHHELLAIKYGNGKERIIFRKKIAGVSKKSPGFKKFLQESQFIKESLANPSREIKAGNLVSQAVKDYVQQEKDLKKYTDQLDKIDNLKTDEEKKTYIEQKKAREGWLLDPPENDEELIAKFTEELTSKLQETETKINDNQDSVKFLFIERQSYINQFARLQEVKKHLENNLSHLETFKQELSGRFQKLNEEQNSEETQNQAREAYSQLNSIEELIKNTTKSLNKASSLVKDIQKEMDSVFNKDVDSVNLLDKFLKRDPKKYQFKKEEELQEEEI